MHRDMRTERKLIWILDIKASKPSRFNKSIRRVIEPTSQRNMLSTMLCGILLSVVSLSTMVVGDMNHRLEMKTFLVENTNNDYTGPFKGEIKDGGDKGSLLSIHMPVKKDMGEEVLVHLVMQINGQDFADNEMTLCEAMDDKSVGQDVVKAGTPKGDFPTECPFKAGDWKVSDFGAKLDPLPSSAEGELSGFATIGTDTVDFAKITFEGRLYRKDF